jgi:hypothetical protein
MRRSVQARFARSDAVPRSALGRQRDRQVDLEPRPPAELAVHVHAPAVVLDDMSNDRKPEPGSPGLA